MQKKILPVTNLIFYLSVHNQAKYNTHMWLFSCLLKILYEWKRKQKKTCKNDIGDNVLWWRVSVSHCGNLVANFVHLECFHQKRTWVTLYFTITQPLYLFSQTSKEFLLRNFLHKTFVYFPFFASLNFKTQKNLVIKSYSTCAYEPSSSTWSWSSNFS